MTKEEIEKEIEQRVIGELTPVDTDALYRDMLDDCYSFECVGGIFAPMQPSRVLEHVDPVAFRCGMNDFEDSLRDDYEEINENFYDRGEVQDIRDEVEGEASDQQEDEEREEAEASCEGEEERQGKVVKG